MFVVPGFGPALQCGSLAAAFPFSALALRPLPNQHLFTRQQPQTNQVVVLRRSDKDRRSNIPALPERISALSLTEYEWLHGPTLPEPLCTQRLRVIFSLNSSALENHLRHSLRRSVSNANRNILHA
jgi:hypothetical protein